MDVLLSGKTTYKVEVPYRLYETGPAGPKPLMVYLHGFGQDMTIFEEQMADLADIQAYHLFLQGPYADYRVLERDAHRGFGWYLYDGKQGSFEKSLEYTSEFIQGVIDGLIPHLKINRCVVIGYSMGAYVAGFFGFTRWKHTHDIVMIGGRLKTEFFAERNWEKRKHLNMLAVHGKDDAVVSASEQQRCIEEAANKGLKAEIRLLPGGHAITSHTTSTVKEWLLAQGYQKHVSDG